MLGLGLGLQKSTRVGGFIGLLDLFPNAAAAYSLRKLRAAYSGSAVRVRKEVSSVSSETDIGFLGDGSLDTTTLLTFASDADGGDVFVVTWYDQSTNGNYATQSTAANQPKIVSSGAVITEGTSAKPAIDFDGVDDYFNLPSGLAAVFSGQGKALSSFNVASVASVVSGNRTLYSITNTPGSNDNYYHSSHDGSRFRFFARGAGGLLKSSASTNTFGAGQYLKVDILPEESAGVQNGDMYIDSAQEVSSFDYATANKTLTSGAIGVLLRGSLSGYYDGNNQELILYPSDQSTNRAAIETNINTFYSIY